MLAHKILLIMKFLMAEAFAKPEFRKSLFTLALLDPKQDEMLPDMLYQCVGIILRMVLP